MIKTKTLSVRVSIFHIKLKRCYYVTEIHKALTLRTPRHPRVRSVCDTSVACPEPIPCSNRTNSKKRCPNNSIPTSSLSSG